jgi:ABC-2 type transport system permease protein
VPPTGYTPREWVSVYAVKFRVAMAIQLHYRAASAVWLIGAILQPVIFVSVWSAVADAQGGSVNGLTAGDFAAYFIVAMIVNQLTFSWIFWEYEYYIREGQLASRLLRPVHPIHTDIADNLTYKAMTMVVLVPTTLLLIWVFNPTWSFQWWSTIAFLPALFGAFLVRFLLEYALAMAAFWTTRVTALNQLYSVIFLFFSGGIAPLQLLPGPIQTMANLLPFRWTLAFPIELLLGQLTPRDFWVGMGAQLAWLLVALALVAIVWRAGVRRFASVGG